jgi:hypothetical protein
MNVAIKLNDVVNASRYGIAELKRSSKLFPKAPANKNPIRIALT